MFLTRAVPYRLHLNDVMLESTGFVGDYVNVMLSFLLCF